MTRSGASKAVFSNSFKYWLAVFVLFDCLCLFHFGQPLLLNLLLEGIEFALEVASAPTTQPDVPAPNNDQSITGDHKQINHAKKERDSTLAAVDQPRTQDQTQNLALALQSVNAGRVLRHIEKTQAAIDSLRAQRTRWQRTSQEALASEPLRRAPQLIQTWEDLKLNPLATEETLKDWEESLNNLKAALLRIQAATTEQIVEFPEGYQGIITEIELSVRAESDRLNRLQFTLDREKEDAQHAAQRNATIRRQASTNEN